MNSCQMIYEIINNKMPVKILASHFIRKNKKKCRMIFKNKILSLKKEFQIQNEQEKKLKIILIFLESDNLNLRKMFSKCTRLKHFAYKNPKITVLNQLDDINTIDNSNTITLMKTQKENEKKIYI